MSEIYTTGGDAFAKLKIGHYAGQTFRPLETHILEYVDLNLKLWNKRVKPFVGIYHANGNHEPVGECLARDKWWILDQALSPKDWFWYEPWGITLLENHYWLEQPVLNPPLITIVNSQLTIENTGQTAQWISTLLSTINEPLVDPDGKPLYFHHHSPLSTGNPVVHWHSYTFRTEKIPETWTLEGVISHGTAWPPFNGAYRPTPLGGAFFCGQGPDIFNFTQHWINARSALGEDPDPTGWSLTHLQLRVEDVNANPGGKLTNTYTGLARQQHTPPPQNDYLIGEVGFTWPGKLYRVRFAMEKVELIAGNYYVMLSTASPAIFEAGPEWQYDKGDATYPRGIRIYSDDSQATWTKHHNDDHIFTEFGKPPLPQPDPEPPLGHFTPTYIRYTPTWFGLLIAMATATPCHLTCYYTEIKPLKHPTSRTLRGVTAPWGAYFCFTGWHALEQIEAGDTLYHTFDFEEWAVCLTRWFTFRGNIEKELSPSVGPIFKYHHLASPLYEHYNTGDDGEGSVFGTEWRAQTFTPLESHTISFVRLKLFRTGLPQTLTVLIYPTLGGKPTGSYLSFGTTNGNTLPTGPPYEWRDILLTPSYNLIAGVKYAIVLKSQRSEQFNRVNWRIDCSSPTYPRGEALYSHNAGSSWTKVPACDYMFEEYSI